MVRNQVKTMLLFKIFTMGISLLHKASTGFPRRVAKHTISEGKNKNSTADGRKITEAVSPSTIAIPIYQNQDSSM